MNTSYIQAWILGAVLSLSAAVVHAEETLTNSVEKAFVSNGEISIELTAGEHTISRSDDDQIHISWRVDDEDSGEVEASTRVDGSSAKIDIDGPKSNFRTVIKVPTQSNLVVRLSAGVLNIEDIKGSKDIKLRAGELNIEVGNPDEYAEVKGSLWAGDINAGPFSRETSGLFRSIKWQGKGKHSLLFKLYAGDVKLTQAQE